MTAPNLQAVPFQDVLDLRRIISSRIIFSDLAQRRLHRPRRARSAPGGGFGETSLSPVSCFY